MIDRSVWVIERGLDDLDNYIQGSAFFLDGIGLVTAAHCVEGIQDAIVHHPSRPSNTFKVTVSKYSKHLDLAVLAHTIPDNEFFALKISPVPALTGDRVAGIGYPDFGPGDKINIRPGVVSSTKTRSLVNLLEVGFKLTQGMSGGPVVNDKDQVVGVIHKGGPTSREISQLLLLN
jgi:S1-C subfamily serine protease